MYNVFLSGGGLKGAYQYGFFKELYKKWPDFPVKKVFAVSVGAMNSIPIITRRIDALDMFWNDRAQHPFDTIVHDWIDHKPVNRARSYFKHGSVFRAMRREPYELFLKSLDNDEMALVCEKLVIISYDKVDKKMVVQDSLTTHDELIDAIHQSSRYPGLFHARDQDHIDGIFANTTQLVHGTDNMEKWLCIDLQNTLTSNEARIVFSPRICCLPLVNDIAAVLSNRYMIDILIKNGEQDGADFAEWGRIGGDF